MQNYYTKISFILLLILSTNFLYAQSFWFGGQGGLVLGTQKWNNNDRRPMVGYQGDLFLESYNKDASYGSFFAKLGYHQRGSANFYYGSRSNALSSFYFNNLSLQLGVKGKITPSKPNIYYLFGIRGEYTIHTNLSEFQQTPNFFFPSDVFLRRFTGGVTIGSGYAKRISEMIGVFIEANISQDLFKQYYQPPFSNVINPYNPTGNPINLSQRNIINLSFEISVGIKFLRKVIYTD